VPWFVTVNVVDVQDDAVVTVLAQIPDGTAARVVPVPAESFDTGVNVWLTSHPAAPESATAVGGGITVGV